MLFIKLRVDFRYGGKEVFYGLGCCVRAEAEADGVFAEFGVYVHGFEDGALVLFGGAGAAGGD